MKFVFFGTPDFAAIVLEKLIKAGFVPAAVICAPDAPAGRKKIITPPPTKLLTLKYDIPFFQPKVLNSDFRFRISDFKAELFVVAAYAKILSKEILDIPRLGTIGVHPSLLPKYRGASPVQSAILADESETGVTLYLMDEKVDHGPIITKSEILISKSETYESLHKKLAELSGDLLIETLPKFLKGEINSEPQNGAKVIFTRKFSLKDGLVDLQNDNPRQIWLKIRALNPEPGVYANFKLKNDKELKLKLLEADFKNEKLELKIVQPEGKKPMSWKDFLNGYRSVLSPALL